MPCSRPCCSAQARRSSTRPLIAAISDAVPPVARAPVVGVYRFWRDAGYVAGALVAGLVADAIGFSGAIVVVAGLTAASGLWVAFDLPARRAGVAGRPADAWPSGEGGIRTLERG